MSDADIKKEDAEKNFSKIMKQLGYQKKSKILADFLPEKQSYSAEAVIKKTPEQYNALLADQDYTLDDFQKDSQIISDPAYVDIYNFITKDNILLS